MGMTNEQYRGVLVQWLDDLQEVLKEMEKDNNEKAEELLRHKIEVTKKMLEF